MKKAVKSLTAGALSAIIMATSVFSSPLPMNVFAQDISSEIQKEIFVATDGSDTNDGSEAHPFATLERAREEVDKINDNMTGDIIVNIGAGEYYQTDTLHFDEGDSGTNGYRVIYRSEDGPAKAKVIGGYRLDSEWELVERSGADADLPSSAEGKVYKTYVGTEHIFNTLYVNDERATLARTKNRTYNERFATAMGEYMETTGGGVNYFVYKDGDLDEEAINGLVNAQKRGEMDAQIFVWDGGYWDWMTDTLPIATINPETRRVDIKQDVNDPAKYRPKYSIGSSARYFLQGNLGFLDVAGEYYFNKTTGYLYYYPEGEISDQEIVVPTTQKVVELKGESLENKVRNITFDGLQFKDSDTTEWYAYGWNWGDAGAGLGYYPPEAEGSTLPSYCEQSERAEFQVGVINMTNTEGITITNSHIKNSGMWGVDLYMGNQYTDINNCLIEYTGHGGVNLEGGYPGVGGDENGDGYNRDNKITNCLIHDMGQLVGQTAGVAVNNSSYTTISHCEIYNSPRRLVMYTAGMQRNPNVGYPDGDRDVNRMTDIYTHHNTTEYTYLHDGQQDGGDDGAFFACYLFYGQEEYKPNYINQVVVDRIGANPSMDDLTPCGLSNDMGCSGMHISNFQSVNTQHMNGQLSSARSPSIGGYDCKITLENTNIQYPYDAVIVGDKEFDPSKMEYDKIGVDWSTFPTEYVTERSDYQTVDLGPDKDEVYFEDEFESENIDFKKWDYEGNKPEITDLWMSEYVFDGKGSLYLDGESKLYREFDQQLNKKVSVKFFDRQNYHLGSAVEGWFKIPPRSFATISNGEYQFGVGLDTAADSKFYILQDGDKTITTEIPRTYGWHKVEWDFTDGESVKVYLDGTLLADSKEMSSFNRIELGSEDGKGISWYDQLYVYGGEDAPPVEPLPDVYGIPGTVEAENYLNASGVETENCSDTEGGLNLCQLNYGDWAEYNVRVETTGLYDLSYRADIPEGKTADIDILVDGELVKTAEFKGEKAGWNDYKEQVKLESGRHTIRMIVRSEDWKLNYLKFDFSGNLPGSRIEAEDFTEMNGMQLDGPGLGYIGKGAWAEYKINIPKAGEYQVNYRIAANRNNEGVAFTMNGKVLATTSFKYTGGWQSWETVSDTVNITETGDQTIRLEMLDANWNFDYFELVPVNVSAADKTELQACYEKYSEWTQGSYTDESWNEFVNALKTVRNTLVNEDATQDEVDNAVQAMEKAASNLTEEGQSVNKTLLQKTYDYALTLDTEGVTESAMKFFEEAKAAAKAVLDDPNATQEEVNTAWDTLLKGIWGLGLKQGDKSQLELLIGRADQMMEDADKYVKDHWQQLADALEVAKDVYNDGDAMDEDIQPAAESLLNAILAQRFKADKSNLEDLINKAESIDLSKYTEESVAVFEAALKSANLVLADDNLSEDDQDIVDNAVKDLTEAIENLSAVDEKDPSDSSDTDNGDSSDKPQNEEKTDSPTTGDNSNGFLWFAFAFAGLMTATLVVTQRKKSKNNE